MKVYFGANLVDADLRGAVLTIGNFDGVHLGHQHIIETARSVARERGLPVVAMTFEPHPIAVLRPQHAPPRLTPWEEKVERLQDRGVDAVVRVEADQALLSMNAEAFVRDVLVGCLRPSTIVEGPDFGFGRGRAGNVALLETMGVALGYRVIVVPPHRLSLDGNDVTVSSSVIRERLAAGAVEQAAACLGRPYRLIAPVIKGEGRGRGLGFPTINLGVRNQITPGDGVYAGWAGVAGRRSQAAISIGCRPTFGETERAVEAFLLDASGDWYGDVAAIDFVRRLRDQVRFDSPEALRRQIDMDVESIRSLLAGDSPRPK